MDSHTVPTDNAALHRHLIDEHDEPLREDVDLADHEPWNWWGVHAQRHGERQWQHGHEHTHNGIDPE